MRKELQLYQVEVQKTVLPECHPFYSEWRLIERVGQKALNSILQGLEIYSEGTLRVSPETHSILTPSLAQLKDFYLRAMLLSEELSERALHQRRYCPARVPFHNPRMAAKRDRIDNVFHSASKAWVLDGIVPEAQRAGLKKLFGIDGYPGIVHDVLGSATSLNLGSHFPWVSIADHYEDHLGIRDNFCTAYHAAIKQGFALPELSKLYPNESMWNNLRVFAECSGTIVNSVAIETACAYATKILGWKPDGKKPPRVLAVDGTWAGGYGSAREGTGFGVTKQLEKRGGNVWVNRCLPIPTIENKEKFLAILREKIASGECAGVFIEPRVIGDLGIIETNETLLSEMIDILKEGFNGKPVPVILDCVQQGTGRTGNYWGLPDVPELINYPGLILTTAKSASNGQAIGFTVMPAEISNAAYPYSHITTNQMNGSLLRALVVAKIVEHPEIKTAIARKGQIMEDVAGEYGFKIGPEGLRGKVMNRGIYLGNNDLVETVQVALMIQDGILVGALPGTIRIQPMLLEGEETIRNLMHVICRRVKEVKRGNIPKEILAAVNAEDIPTGLAMKSTTKEI